MTTLSPLLPHLPHQMPDSVAAVPMEEGDEDGEEDDGEDIGDDSGSDEDEGGDASAPGEKSCRCAEGATYEFSRAGGLTTCTVSRKAVSSLRHNDGAMQRAYHSHRYLRAPQFLRGHCGDLCCARRCAGSRRRRGKGSGNAGKPGKRLRLEQLQSHFGVGLKEAASRLGICATTLKRACRRHGATRQRSMTTDRVRCHAAAHVELTLDAAALLAGRTASLNAVHHLRGNVLNFDCSMHRHAGGCSRYVSIRISLSLFLCAGIQRWPRRQLMKMSKAMDSLDTGGSAALVGTPASGGMMMPAGSAGVAGLQRCVSS